LILLGEEGQSATVVECSPSAREAGIQSGMRERLARTRCPEGVFLYQDVERQRGLEEEFFETLESFSPRVELPYPGLAFLDMGPWRDQDKASSQCLLLYSALLQNPGFPVRVGVGTNRFVSRVAALLSFPGKGLIIAPGQERDFLSSCPTSLLPLSKKLLMKLEFLGLQTLGQIAKIPAADLLLQFGKDGEKLSRLCLGEDFTPVRGETRLRPPHFKRVFESPVKDSGTLIRLMDQDLKALLVSLRFMRRRCSRLEFRFLLEDGQEKAYTVRFSSPQGKEDGFLKFVESRLASLTFSKPVEICEVWPAGLLRGFFVQGNLFGKVREERMQELSRQLGKKGCSLYKVHLGDPESRIPERRAFLNGLLDPLEKTPLYLPSRIRVKEKGGLCLVRIDGSDQRIGKILEKWVVEEDWWELSSISRIYYRVLLCSGVIRKIFYDRVGGQWYRQPGF
jgi:nucleotidyltransferase/DNA polymerase involved in DNA repair